MRNAFGIIGLGLIGGSMAKAVRKSIQQNATGFVERIFAADLNTDYIEKAAAEGIIDGELTDGILSECKLISIAIPPRATLNWIKENAPKLTGAILIDLCGVKGFICEEAEPLARQYGFTFIGGHPMAGKEVGGYENATESLFNGASMILTPNDEIDKSLLEELEKFYLSLGFAKITKCTHERHDDIIAYTSQLAHIVSSAYMKSPTAQNHEGFSAGSYKDLTRVARLDEDLWTELLMENRYYLLAEMDCIINHLKNYREVLEKGNRKELHRMLRIGRELKEEDNSR